MIIYRQYHHEGAPVYEIITKTFQHVSIKCDDSFSDTEIFKLLSLLQDDMIIWKLVKLTNRSNNPEFIKHWYSCYYYFRLMHPRAKKET